MQTGATSAAMFRNLFRLALMAACGAVALKVHAKEGPPNVIFVMFDALRPDHVGALGHEDAATPRLDRFAEESLVFENAVAQAPWTLPSVASLFTSLYPQDHKLINRFAVAGPASRETAKLAYDIVTLAQALRDSGYATAAFTGGAGLDADTGLGRGFDVYSGSVAFGGFDRTFPMALEWLRERRGGPFFLFVHGYDVHGQFRPGGAEGERQGRYMELRSKVIQGEPVTVAEEDLRFWIERYDRRIEDADRRFGAFLDAVWALEGLKERTIVVAFSDHGDEFHEHGGIDHGMTLYDEAIRTVLMMRRPGTPARRIREQVRLIDVMPTVLDWTGVRRTRRVRRQMRGVSLTPLGRGRTMGLNAFSETDFLHQASKRSLRSPDGWKFIHDRLSGSRELYDLRDDPRERHDLFEQRPDVAYPMERELSRHIQRK